MKMVEAFRQDSEIVLSSNAGSELSTNHPYAVGSKNFADAAGILKNHKGNDYDELFQFGAPGEAESLFLSMTNDIRSGRFTDQGKTAFRRTFAELSGDPISESRANGNSELWASYLDAGAWLFRRIDEKGDYHYFASIIKGRETDRLINEQSNWEQSAAEAVSRGERIPAIPESLSGNLIEIGAKKMPPALLPAFDQITKDFREGRGLTDAGIRELKRLAKDVDNPNIPDSQAVLALRDLTERVNDAMHYPFFGDAALKFDKTTDDDGTQHYIITADGKQVDLGPRVLPGELTPAFKQIVEDIKSGKGLTSDGVRAIQELIKLYDNDPMLSISNIRSPLRELNARIYGLFALNPEFSLEAEIYGASLRYVAKLGGLTTELATRELPEVYKPILESAAQAANHPERRAQWGEEARSALKIAYEHFRTRDGANAQFIGSELNELRGLINVAAGRNVVSLSTNVVGKSTSWSVLISRGTVGGTDNPTQFDDAVTLGPYEEPTKL
jgi:hypothetical protein